MISYLAYSTFCMGVLLLFYHTTLIKEKMYHINRGYLLFSLIFSLSIPLIPVGITGSVFPFLENIQLADYGASNPASYLTGTEAAAGSSVAQDSPPRGKAESSASAFLFITRILVVVYIAVATILFVRLLRVVHMIQMKAGRNPRTLFKGYELVLVSEKVVPHTFFSTIFVNMKQYRRGEIGREMLLHELAHARQKHTYDIIVVEFLKILFWFNPFLYLYKKAIVLNHEFLADEAVISKGIRLPEYQQTLLNTVLRNPSNVLASNLNYGHAKKRLFMMTQPVNKTRSMMKTISFIPLFVTLALILGCESTPSEPETQVKNVTIELTESDMVKLDGDLIHVDELEGALDELSQNYELHFLVKNHSRMKTDPATTVNSLVQRYGESEETGRTSVVNIEITGSDEIRVDQEPVSIDELDDKLEQFEFKENLIVSFRVAKEASFGVITEVQTKLRMHELRRINYSTIDSSGEENTRTKSTAVLERNILQILVNKQGMMLVNEEPSTLPELKDQIKSFIDNKGEDPRLPESPERAIVSVKTDKKTPHGVYIKVLDEIMAAYSDLRDEISRERFGVPFSSLEESSEAWQEIREAYPKKISIAEPQPE